MTVLITRLSLAIGSGCLDLRKPLLDLMLPAQGHKRMVLRISSILLPVVGVGLLYRIRTFFQDLFQEYPSCILGLVRKDRPIRFGIAVSDVSRWVRQYRQDQQDLSEGGIPRKGLDAEIRRLKKENKRLEMEREILKKAAVFFAKESN